MINKRDFDDINSGIAQTNASRSCLKTALLSIAILVMLFSCMMYSFRQSAGIGNFALAIFVVPVVLFLRYLIKYKPYYTFEQYTYERTAQKFYAQQVEAEYTMLYGYSGVPQGIDSRYIPDALRQAVLSRDNYRCCFCGSNLYLELDHIIPLSRGGATTYENLQVLCHGCNQRKGNR